MIVLHSYAHSDPRNGPGAELASGYTERQFARDVAPALVATLEASGHTVETYRGDLRKTIRQMYAHQKLCMDNNNPWCSVEVHFNQTPLEHCVQCGAERRTGTVCQSCGAGPSQMWRWGPSALYWAYSMQSLVLATSIIQALCEIMPWSHRRKPIPLPSAQYGRKAWVEDLAPPAVLVEAGFAPDYRFAEFIEDDAGPAAIGQAIGQAVCDLAIYYRDRPVSRWGA